MIAAFDVHYLPDGKASAAAVLFNEYTDRHPSLEHTILTDVSSRYIPGQFYRREMPCILRVIEQFGEMPREMIVDGYVMLGDRPGLGRHLFDHFAGKVSVIGVAKSKYKGSTGIEVLRGRSGRPLYVTAAGADPAAAAEKIRAMYGPHRLPALLKRVDLLARGAV